MSFEHLLSGSVWITLYLTMTLLRKTVDYPSEDDSIRKYLGFNLKLLSFIGLEFNLNNDRPIKKSRFVQTLPIFMTNTLSLTVAIIEVTFIRVVLKQHEKHLAAQISSELFSNILCISKVFMKNKSTLPN